MAVYPGWWDSIERCDGPSTTCTKHDHSFAKNARLQRLKHEADLAAFAALPRWKRVLFMLCGKKPACEWWRVS